MLINLDLKDKWLSCVGGKPCFSLVGDNEDYIIHFNTDLTKAAVFAVFKRDRNEERILLDSDGNVTVPLWVLKSGIFNVGLCTDGFASTPLPVYVIGSIINDDSVPTEDPPKTQIQQLIELVNQALAGQSGVNIKNVYIENGELIIELSNGDTINAGKCCEAPLPAVTNEDNGKILQVENGEWTAKPLDVYTGKYSVIPSAVSQTLSTADKVMTDDLKVEEIPYHEVSNESGGTTINIG